MVDGKITTERVEEIPAVDFPDIGYGTSRTSGTYIALLLSLEEPSDRAMILVDVAKQMGITLDELSGRYTDKGCPKCGVSLYDHKENGGCF